MSFAPPWFRPIILLQQRTCNAQTLTSSATSEPYMYSMLVTASDLLYRRHGCGIDTRPSRHLRQAGHI